MGETLITFLASYLIFVILLSLVGWWVIDGRRDKEMIAAAVIAGVAAWLLVFIVKDLVNIPRPFVVDGNGALTMTVPMDGAFPSGHAALLFALAAVVWKRNRKWGVVYMLLAGLVGVGRVLAHVHYPGDILAGAGVGVGVGWLVSQFNLRGVVKRINR